MSIFGQHDEIVRDLIGLYDSAPCTVVGRALELLDAYRERLHEVETSDITIATQELAETRDQVAQLSTALAVERGRLAALEAVVIAYWEPGVVECETDAGGTRWWRVNTATHGYVATTLAGALDALRAAYPPAPQETSTTGESGEPR